MHSKGKGLVHVCAAAVSCTHPEDYWRQLAFHLVIEDLPKTYTLKHEEPHTLSNIIIYITHSRSGYGINQYFVIFVTSQTHKCLAQLSISKALPKVWLKGSLLQIY